MSLSQLCDLSAHQPWLNIRVNDVLIDGATSYQANNYTVTSLPGSVTTSGNTISILVTAPGVTGQAASLVTVLNPLLTPSTFVSTTCHYLSDGATTNGVPVVYTDPPVDGSVNINVVNVLGGNLSNPLTIQVQIDGPNY